MITDNSGKLYRFKLDHGFGYGFAETYDFTDDSPFDGRYCFVYDRVDVEMRKTYDGKELRANALALGPITLYRFPNVRGVGSWKFLMKTDELIITDRPKCKSNQGSRVGDDWSQGQYWYIWPHDLKKQREYVDYELVRNLETRILNASPGIVCKFTMKTILDRGFKVGSYYDLSDVCKKNMFVQLVNTYYPLEEARMHLLEIPR